MSMSASMRKGAKIALYAQGKLIVSEFQARSPVDTGFYKRNWHIARDRFASSNKFAGVTLYNDAPYAYWMEEGGEVRGEPWGFPDPKKKRTGRLKVANGRVWAGGFSPGHSNTVGGAIGPALLNNNRRQMVLVNAIVDGIIGAIK